MVALEDGVDHRPSRLHGVLAGKEWDCSPAPAGTFCGVNQIFVSAFLIRRRLLHSTPDPSPSTRRSDRRRRDLGNALQRPRAAPNATLFSCIRPSEVLVDRRWRRGLDDAILRILKFYFIRPVASALVMLVQANFLISIKRHG